MQDQHDNLLTNFYKNSIQNAKLYLEAKYRLISNTNDEEILDIARILSPEYPEYEEFWKIELNGSLRCFTFILAIPDTFPDTFPKIYLSKKDFQEIYPVPHLDKNRFVCTRNPEVVFLNDKKPGEAIEELINIAVKILEQGIKTENQSDFIEEFLAYWNEKTQYSFLSLFVPTDKIANLKIFKLSKNIFRSKYIVSESKEDVEKWVAPFKINIDESEDIGCLYLPLSKFYPLSFEKDEDVSNILKNLSNKEEHTKAVGNYFNQNRHYYIIISSFPIKKERILFGWRHKGWSGVRFKGFRKNHVPLHARLTHTKTKNNPIEKIEIIRLDKERIFKRGGTMSTLLSKNVSIALVGCGSLGSYLAMSLSRCGISKFLLIDKDYLEPENVPRHLCGFIEASQHMKKVDAVKKKLIEHFPYIECRTHFGDVLQLYQKENITLKDYDLAIIAIGSVSIERRINYLLRKGSISCPVVYLWIEPFGVGGHILYIHPSNGGCYECCFDNNGNFLYSIVEPAGRGKFQKRESGCQSTFLPYSSLDIEHFISVSCKKILHVLEKEKEISILYTWLGDIEEFERLGYRINSIHDAQLPYRIIEKNILSQKSCSLCGKVV